MATYAFQIIESFCKKILQRHTFFVTVVTLCDIFIVDINGVFVLNIFRKSRF